MQENISNEEIRQACQVLQTGGVILYPTDTVWGLGCDATNESAVRKVQAIKGREEHKAMLVLVDSPAKVQAYVEDVPDIAWDLMEVADKPLTLIFDKGRNLAPGLLGEDGSIGIRVTAEPFSHRLCQAFRRPVVSTSANRSGEPFPATFAAITEAIREAADYVARYRRDDTTAAQPSGIIRLGAGGLFQIIR